MEPADDEPLSAEDQRRTEEWRRMLTGEDPGLASMRRRWSRIPSAPRCKMCAAPDEAVLRWATQASLQTTTKGT